MHDDGPARPDWSRIDWSVLLILLLLAIATRGWGLAEGSFRVDEYYTVYKAEQRATSLFNPAYNVLALVSFRMFGVSEFSARLPAMLLGVLAIPLLFAMWRGVLGRFAATVAALVTLMSSWHLWHSQFARHYAGTFLFGAVAYYLLFQSVRRGSLLHLGGGHHPFRSDTGGHACATRVSVLRRCWMDSISHWAALTLRLMYSFSSADASLLCNRRR